MARIKNKMPMRGCFFPYKTIRPKLPEHPVIGTNKHPVGPADTTF